MNKKNAKGLIKHLDFIIIDILCLQLCCIFSFWIINGISNHFINEMYMYTGTVFLVSQLFVILFSENYSGILRRKKYDETIWVLKHSVTVLLFFVLVVFVFHSWEKVSRKQVGFTLVMFILLDNIFRYINKKVLFSIYSADKFKRSVVLITGKDIYEEAVSRLATGSIYNNILISRIVLLDSFEANEFCGIPISPLNEETLKMISHDWVDEVFVLNPSGLKLPSNIIETLLTMGITVHCSLSTIFDDRWPITGLEKLGDYKVLTSSIRFASREEVILKRIIDICGSIVGCIFTGLLVLFVGPAIYVKSPGPIFFSQERIGKNGKKFKMYKFRSMYLDAEARLESLQKYNKVQDGMMFKMDDDPRIIGSEKKDKNGKPKGIGNFIRNTSIDEFPQFYNVLKGDMSLVGWRPCTLNEWEKYEFRHRIRASMKPGITGLWQVSGRSDINDFEEVVRLDKEYLENWSIALDIKILIKTVLVVLTKRGAK